MRCDIAVRAAGSNVWSAGWLQPGANVEPSGMVTDHQNCVIYIYIYYKVDLVLKKGVHLLLRECTEEQGGQSLGGSRKP